MQFSGGFPKDQGRTDKVSYFLRWSAIVLRSHEGCKHVVALRRTQQDRPGRGRTFWWHGEGPPHLVCEYGSRSSVPKAEQRYHYHDEMLAWFLNDNTAVGWSWEVIEERNDCGAPHSGSLPCQCFGRGNYATYLSTSTLGLFLRRRHDRPQRNAECTSKILPLLSCRADTPLEQVIDNSGALLVECVNVLKQKVNNGWGSVGDEIVCVVKRARPLTAAQAASATALKVRRGDVRRALIVRTKKAVRRPDGRFVRFDDNAAVLLNNKREMLGTRIGGIVSADLRLKGWGKIVSLAPKVRVGN